MSAAAGPREFELEKAAIHAAYTRAIGRMFDEFFISASAGGWAAPDRHKSLVKFKDNLEAARRAHVMALSIFSDHDKI